MYRGVVKVGAIGLAVCLLVGLGIGAIVRMREKANRARCMDHLRRVGWVAMWDYTDAKTAFPNGRNAADAAKVLMSDAQPDPNRLFPPGTLPHPSLPPERRLSWQFILAPHFDRSDAVTQFSRDKAWDAEENKAGLATVVSSLICPSQFRPVPTGEPIVTHYIGMAGVGADAPTLPQTHARAGFLRYDDPTRTGSVVRGFSYTISIMETSTEPGPWAAGGPATVRGLDPQRLPYIGRQFGGHPEGANAAFADGSVRFQSLRIADRLLEMMAKLKDADE